jgi:hypothetical protein
MIVFGEKIRCDLLIVRYPPILQFWQRFIPHIEPKEIRVVINQPPMSDYGPHAVLRYELPRVAENLKKFFGKGAIWHPIGPAVRDALITHHSNDLHAINLSPWDWVNVIDLSSWQRAARPSRGIRPRIGRHARDDRMKWPSDKETLLKVYPNSNEYDVHILGGASVPKRMLGRLPANWTIKPFDAITPKEFVASLDVFVYYTHPNWVESFGRVIIEAMACGVPVVLPPSYRRLFEDAATYAEPDDVLAIVNRLMADSVFYERKATWASEYVQKRFSHQVHLERVRKIIEES